MEGKRTLKRRKFVTTVALGGIMTAVAGCTGGESTDSASGGSDGGSNGNSDGSNGGGGSNDAPEETADPESDEPDVKILEHEMEYDDMMGAKVVGKVKNTTDSELSYMQVKAKFFDDSDTRVGEGMWNASDVSAGTEVQFETIPAQVDS